MSTIGKVLVFLVLVLSVAFLASSIFVLNKQESYRQQLDDEKALHSKEVSARDATITKLGGELDTTKNELARLDGQLRGVTVDRDNKDSQLKAAETFKGAVETNMSKMATDLDNYGKRNDDLQKTVAASRTEADTARADRDKYKKEAEDAQNKEVLAQNDSKQLTDAKNALEAQVKKLLDDNALKDNALAVYAARTSIPVDQVYHAPPSIQGNVVSTSLDVKLIQLNVGSDANVKKGYGFTIYRGSEYKGEAIVEEVQAKFATARILSMVKPIMVGDMARAGIF